MPFESLPLEKPCKSLKHPTLDPGQLDAEGRPASSGGARPQNDGTRPDEILKVPRR